MTIPDTDKHMCVYSYCGNMLKLNEEGKCVDADGDDDDDYMMELSKDLDVETEQWDDFFV